MAKIRNIKRIPLVVFGTSLGAFIVAIAVMLSGIPSRSIVNDFSFYRTSQIPGITGEHIPGARGMTDNIPIQINPLGLRDYEYPLKKRKGTLRILVLGDSITFGEGVWLEETFAKRLEKDLQEFPNKKIEVINAGVCGYNTLEEYLYLRERGIKLDPDIVIIAFYLNDAENRHHQMKLPQKAGLRRLNTKIRLIS